MDTKDMNTEAHKNIIKATKSDMEKIARFKIKKLQEVIIIIERKPNKNPQARIAELGILKGAVATLLKSEALKSPTVLSGIIRSTLAHSRWQRTMLKLGNNSKKKQVTEKANYEGVKAAAIKLLRLERVCSKLLVALQDQAAKTHFDNNFK